MNYSLESRPIFSASLSKDCSTIIYCTTDNGIIEIPVEKHAHLMSINQTSKI